MVGAGMAAGDASPARAGMYLILTETPTDRGSFPRTRGDVPAGLARSAFACALPPHARGCTSCRMARRVSAAASPARAGMYPQRAYSNFKFMSFPRTRGDVPELPSYPRHGEGLPPHARGCTVHGMTDAAGVGASPARAGMYPRPTRRRTPPSSFPRTRGDVPAKHRRLIVRQQLPPHARGCTALAHSRRIGYGASPARAGMYPLQALDR